MAGSSFSLTYDQKQVDRISTFLNDRVWKGELENDIKKATMANALYLIREVKKSINSREYNRNSALTLALKKTNLALTDQRNLWRAIQYELKDSFTAEVGIINDGAVTDSKFGKNKTSKIGLKKLVELIESGYTIKVTPAMKKAMAIAIQQKSDEKTDQGKVNKKSKTVAHNFQRKFRKHINNGNGSTSLPKTGVTTFIVPPRKIFSSVWNRKDVQQNVMRNWRKALEGTFKKMGRG